jgi:spore maturation protein CgeB
MKRRSITIAFFGSSLVSAYWNGAATYYRGLSRALHQRGHRIWFFEPDAFQRQQHRDIDDPPYARVHVYGAGNRKGVDNALRLAREADIVIKASGVGVFDELLEAAVLEQRRPDNRVAYWDVDAPATLAAMQGSPPPPLKDLVPSYDLVLTYGGGDAVVAAYLALGARRCVPVYNAVDPATHFPVPAVERFCCDLGLLANRMPDREERVHEFFFKPASELISRQFLLGGSGWEANIPKLSNITYLGHIYSTDHNAFNASCRAVLNINRSSMAAVGFSPPTRIFEAAGAGACLITDAWQGIESFLTPGRECLVAHSGAEVADLLQALQPEQARAIGLAALERVSREHTYEQRARQVENLFWEALEA